MASPTTAPVQTTASRAPALGRLTLLDLFAGCGGLSIGLARAGFEVTGAVEVDGDACETFQAVHATADVSESDISALDFRRYRGEIALIAAGVPCQPFSSGGKRLAGDDPRDGFPQFLRAVREVRPNAVCVENVPGLTRAARSGYFESLIRSIEQLGFKVSWKLMNAADYGVPQRRQRLVIVGLRDREFAFPAPTHGSDRPQEWVPAGSVVSQDRILGEPNPSIVTFARSPDLRPSPYDGHLFNGGGRPIDLEKPSHTILASAGGNKTHWVDTLGVVPEYHANLMAGNRPLEGEVPGARRLTVEESALLQSFPREVKFIGARSTCYTQIGNAVPPLLAEVLGRALAAALFDRSA